MTKNEMHRDRAGTRQKFSSPKFLGGVIWGSFGLLAQKHLTHCVPYRQMR